MKSFVALLTIFVVALMVTIGDAQTRRQQRRDDRRPQQQAPKQFWPFSYDEPEANPSPDPQTPRWVLPLSGDDRNVFLAAKLGGYSRANHTKNGVTVDIYQARGKQRAVWEVCNTGSWRYQLGNILYLRMMTGANIAGLIHVMTKGETGPPDYVTQTCAQNNIWLLCVDPATGELTKVIYDPEHPPAPLPAPLPSPVPQPEPPPEEPLPDPGPETPTFPLLQHSH